MLKKILFIIVIILLIAGGVRLVKIKKTRIAEIPLPAQQVLAVKTTLVTQGEFPISKTLLGEIVAKHQAALAARITSHILAVNVREGAMVNKGDILIQLDDRAEKDRITATRADLAAARTQLATQSSIFSRDRKLFAALAISQEQLDTSRANHDAAKARVTALAKSLNTAITNLSYTMITAPVNGIITARLVDPGDLATPGKPLLGLEEETAGYYIQVNIPQADFSRVHQGDKAEIIPDHFVDGSSSLTITARISRIHPAISLGTLATVEIDLATQPFNLPTGGTVRVSLVEGTASGWKVPARAVLENVKHNYVFTVDNQRHVHIVPAVILAKNDNWLVIDASLSENSWLIVAQESALLRLHEKQSVKVVQ